MPSKMLLFVIVFVTLACGMGVAKQKAMAVNWIEARDTIRAPDTGPTPPALHPEDYEPYRKPGGATITGVIKVTLPDGTLVPCRFGLSGDEAYLFPAMLYTRWAIERWTTLIDHKYFDKSTGAEFYPGDGDSRIPMPSYLEIGPGSIIGESECAGDGRFAFEHVPVGRYTIIGTAGLDHLVGSSGESRESVITTPVGPVEVITEGHPSTRAILGQQWTIVSVGNIVVTDSTTYVVKSSALKPAATYFVSQSS